MGGQCCSHWRWESAVFGVKEDAWEGKDGTSGTGSHAEPNSSWLWTRITRKNPSSFFLAFWWEAQTAQLLEEQPFCSKTFLKQRLMRCLLAFAVYWQVKLRGKIITSCYILRDVLQVTAAVLSCWSWQNSSISLFPVLLQQCLCGVQSSCNYRENSHRKRVPPSAPLFGSWEPACVPFPAAQSAASAALSVSTADPGSTALSLIPQTVFSVLTVWWMLFSAFLKCRNCNICSHIVCKDRKLQHRRWIHCMKPCFLPFSHSPVLLCWHLHLYLPSQGGTAATEEAVCSSCSAVGSWYSPALPAVCGAARSVPPGLSRSLQ